MKQDESTIGTIDKGATITAAETHTPTPSIYEINRTINQAIKDLKAHVDAINTRIEELKELKCYNPHGANNTDSGTAKEDAEILKMLSQHRGDTITCRSIAEYMSTILKKFVVTENHLRRLALENPDLFKVIKTDMYSETAMVNGKAGFAISPNPTLKRLSCVKIFNLK